MQLPEVPPQAWPEPAVVLPQVHSPAALQPSPAPQRRPQEPQLFESVWVLTHWPEQAVAVTMLGSRLDQLAQQEGWLARFDMFDWVGGRTSITSAVGLLPAALIGAAVLCCLAGPALAHRVAANHVSVDVGRELVADCLAGIDPPTI